LTSVTGAKSASGSNAHQQRVAVGLGLGHDLGADDAAGARSVVDHHLLSQAGAEMLADQPRHDVEHAGARGERHDDAQRTVGIGLRQHRRAGSQRDQGDGRE
jgi:hypothetical protein